MFFPLLVELTTSKHGWQPLYSVAQIRPNLLKSVAISTMLREYDHGVPTSRSMLLFCRGCLQRRKGRRSASMPGENSKKRHTTVWRISLRASSMSTKFSVIGLKVGRRPVDGPEAAAI